MLQFGTDGVRGEFGTELTTEYVGALARVVAKVLQCKLVIIGRDTRESGPTLESAITKSLTQLGVEVHLMGVAPTPAIAHAAASRNVVALAITASHNPYQDNGVKIFGSGGRKLTDDEESRIETALATELKSRSTDELAKTGLVQYRVNYLDQYRASLIATVPKNSLAKLRITIDCANGALSSVAPDVFGALGAIVTTINATPNGQNINHECGATNPVALSDTVRQFGAHLGIAFDGDGDRLIAIDNTGTVVDGDHLLAISAREMKRQGILRNNAVAVTVMTNIGFHRAMKEAGIDVVTTPVGDRAVLTAIQDNDLSLGGEQSGHIIYRDLATTGDGLLAAIRLATLVASATKSFSEIASDAMTSFPQVLINIRVANRAIDIEQMFTVEIAQAQQTLADNGRVLVRPSGTEPVVRVMVEASRQDDAQSVATTLADAITARLG
ncbi:MAG: phosphoglucosamine mutase [Acidimicrobiaceae bacterium]|nr:phosphoglucosamine mutase [Acidimicrobiaceae bacterium]